MFEPAHQHERDRGARTGYQALNQRTDLVRRQRSKFDALVDQFALEALA